MRFVKMQGTGNDFLLVEAKDEERDWGALARAMCDRHYGAGADGLMLVLRSLGRMCGCGCSTRMGRRRR